MALKSATHQKTSSHTQNDTPTETNRQGTEIQARGTTTKATNTQLMTTGKRQQIQKGRRNHTKIR